MNEQIDREKYINLKNNMYNIKVNIIELEDMYEDLIMNIKESFMIDNKIIYEEKFNQIQDNIKKIKNETINEIIPRINDKI